MDTTLDKVLKLLRRPPVIFSLVLIALIGLAIGGWIGSLRQQAVEPTAPPTAAFTMTPTRPAPAPTSTLAVAAPGTASVPATSTPAPMTPPSTTPSTHEVQTGETLSGIAWQYGITVEALMQANGLTSELIQVGQKLQIPATEAAPTATPLPEGIRIHVVKEGDTLGGIALQYGVSVAALREANDLDSDMIRIGQELTIPSGDAPGTPPEAVVTPTVAATTEETAGAPPDETWRPSPLSADPATYSQTETRGRYTLHYPPDSRPARELDAVLAMVDRAIRQIEEPLGIQLDGTFHVYAAGSLFAGGDIALRGRSFSSQRRLFFLWDGTGDEADRQYIITHEATHTFTWNAIAQPSSVMLHEGVAVFTGMPNYENAGYVNLDDFCAVFHRAGKLPLPTARMNFQGHIYDLTTYYSAGSFVRYLINTYGAEKFTRLYASGDYAAIYGESLRTLQDAWLAQLDARELPADLDTEALIQYVDEVGQTYRQLFANFTGTPAEMRAYRALDKARTSTLAGRFSDARAYLNEFAAARP